MNLLRKRRFGYPVLPSYVAAESDADRRSSGFFTAVSVGVRLRTVSEAEKRLDVAAARRCFWRQAGRCSGTVKAGPGETVIVLLGRGILETVRSIGAGVGRTRAHPSLGLAC